MLTAGLAGEPAPDGASNQQVWDRWNGLDRSAQALVRTTGPEREFGRTLGPQVGVGPVPDPADGVLSAPAEAVARLIAGRLGPEHTPEGVELSGPISLAQLRRVFPGF